MAAQMAAQNGPAPLSTAIAMPSSMPNLVSALPTQTQRLQSTLNDTVAKGSGIDQIHNPFLRGLARSADIAGSVFGPTRALEMAIPGTELNHQIRVNQQERQLALSQKSDQEQAKTAQTQAGTAHENAETSALTAPNYTPLQTDSGTVAFDHKTGKAEPVLGADGTQVGAPDKTPKPLTIEEQAYNYAVKSGKNPLDAYSAVYGAKNTKEAGLPQQYLDAISSGDTTKAGLIKKVINDTQVAPKIEVHNATAAPNGVPASTPGQNSPLVQAIIDGRSPAPNSRSKAGMALMAQVTAADPTYDASRYNTYQASQKDLTSGTSGKNINALNTLLNHVQDARNHLPDNGSFSPLNAVENAGGSLVGKNPTGKFDTDAIGIGGEFGKLVSGGVATVDEQKHLQTLLNHNASPNTIKDNLDEIENLAHGKLQGIYAQAKSANHPGAGSNMPSSLPSPGANSSTGSGMGVNLKAAMALPQNQGKAEADVVKDIQSHGHTVIR